jgi:hypothetical protein
MMHLRSAFILVELSLLIGFCGNSDGQKVSASVNQQELSLNRTKDGQHASAKVGERIVVTLQTIGGGHYDTPQISSHAIRFEGESDVSPAKQNPGGPTQVYRFTAVAEGEAQIRVPHTGSNPTVTFTIQVRKD